MIDEMGQNCEVIVHTGDTNSGGETPCMYDQMVLPLNDLKQVGLKVKQTIFTCQYLQHIIIVEF